jgi:hypothetical protein
VLLYKECALIGRFLCVFSVLKGSWEDMMPSSEKCVFHFNSKDQIEKWHLYSDSELGGIIVFLVKIKIEFN